MMKFALIVSAFVLGILSVLIFNTRTNTVSDSLSSESSPAVAPGVEKMGLTAPRIITRKNQVGQLVLGRDATAALIGLVPNFKLYDAKAYLPDIQEAFIEDGVNKTPMAVIGDFNGDGINDVVVMGTAGSQELIVALLSQNLIFHAQVLARGPVPKASLLKYPPQIEGGEESDEHESEIGRQVGLQTYLNLNEAAGKYRGPKDGVKRFRFDSLYVETFRADTKIFAVVDGEFIPWLPRSRR